MRFHTIRKFWINFVDLFQGASIFGFLLIVLPSFWSILSTNRPPVISTFGACFSVSIIGFLAYIASFTFTAIVNRNIYKLIPHRANDPMPSGRISMMFAVCVLFLSSVMFFLTTYFLLSKFALFISILATILFLIYTMFCRSTRHVDFLLGIAISFGVIIGRSTVSTFLDRSTILLLLSSVYWNLIFIGMKSFADYEAHMKLGIKSIVAFYGEKMPKKIRVYVIMTFSLLLLSGAISFPRMDIWYYVLLIILFGFNMRFISDLDLEDTVGVKLAMKIQLTIGLLIAIICYIGRVNNLEKIIDIKNFSL